MKLTKEALKQLIKEEIEAMGGGKDPLQRMKAEHEKSLKMASRVAINHGLKQGFEPRLTQNLLKSAFEAAFKKVALEQDPQAPVDDFIAGRNLDQVPDWAKEYMNNMYDGVVEKATEELEKTANDPQGHMSAIAQDAIEIAKKVQTELIEIVRSPDDEGNTPAGKAKEALKTSDLAKELRRAADLVDFVVAYVQKGV
tara:strand:- start:122 stop:712 length:591 start_codon:yes stop_codon:yes gene_type:complete